MKYSFVFLLFVLITSCQYFDVKKVSSEEVLHEELRTFSWNEVDEYPSFSVCDSLQTKPDKKTCFEQTLGTHLSNYLSQQAFVVSNDIKDTLIVTFSISDSGEAAIVDVLAKPETNAELPELRDIILRSTDALPRIFPATKRGQQVRTQFKIPIVIKVD